MATTLVINGAHREAAPGSTLLDVTRAAGIDIPTLCHDPRLKPLGGCRLCIVRVEGHPHFLSACSTPAEPGMVVETHSPEIEARRRDVLASLAARLPERDPRLPTTPLDALLDTYGLTALDSAVAARRTQPPSPPRWDTAHPYIAVDMRRCITCLRCERICDEVQGEHIWYSHGRGDHLEIRVAGNATLAASACVSCGACADTCPTGAITDRFALERDEPTEWVRTTCAYCGVGCELEAGVNAGRLVRVRPRTDAAVNRGHACVKGRYAHDFVYAPDRVTRPMVRADVEWQPVSWAQAVERVATTFRRLLSTHGPDAIGVLGSSRATNEENYLTQKFARVVLGTNNVDCCARVCHAPTAAAMRVSLGTGAATNSFADIEAAAGFLVVGANPLSNHPIVGARLRAQVGRGAALIVVDPRRTETAAMADLHLALRPGTNVPLLHGIAAALLDEDLVDHAFLAARCEGFDEFRAFLADYRPETIAPDCGVAAEDIRRAARLYAGRRPAMALHGLGLTEHVQGTDGVACLTNLALLTGNLGKPGAGVNPLRGQNNVQGAAHMGCDPSNLTGFVSPAAGKDLFEHVWDAPVPQQPGLNLLQMIDAAEAGTLKAMWVIGWDPLFTTPGGERVRHALQNLDLLVVQDLFLTETAAAAGHVFLPAASSFEKDGTFMNSERRVQRVRKAIETVGDSLDDATIIARVATAMGHGAAFAHADARAVWDEVRRVWAPGAGISYARIEDHGLQWPCPNEHHPGTSILHREQFAHGRRAPLRAIAWRPSRETPSDEYPFLLITGRVLSQFNAGTMTMRTPNTRIYREDLLQMHPDDAARLGLRDGQKIELASRHGRTVLPLRVSDTVKPGEVFATFNDTGVSINRVVSTDRDGTTMTPEYKMTAVAVRGTCDR